MHDISLQILLTFLSDGDIIIIKSTERNKTMAENENITEKPEAAENDPELNEDGVPRPAKDPKNALYTVITLALFAVIYVGWHFVSQELFAPYSKTAFEFTPEVADVLLKETNTPLPEGAELSMARMSSGTDNDLLRIIYKNIGDAEAFAETIGFSYGDILEEQRLSIFADETYNEKYVYADVYVNNDDPDFSCLIYDYDGTTYAEFRKTEYDPAVRSAFDNSQKVK